MKLDFPSRLLTIGEFAAATQLTPKALRLYDEQALLRPASIDASNGYRYYASAQVAQGRVIRTLREMNLSLSEISQIVALPEGQAELLLSQLAQEIDRRYARERRAFQTALMLLRNAPLGAEQAVEERTLPAMTVTVDTFSAVRARFAQRCRIEAAAARERARRMGLEPADAAYCKLVEPVSDEEGTLEILLDVEPPAKPPVDVTLRRISAARYAAAPVQGDTHISNLMPALDALFDWFDRRGYRAAGVPLVRLSSADHDAPTEVLWAFTTNDATEQPP